MRVRIVNAVDTNGTLQDLRAELQDLRAALQDLRAELLDRISIFNRVCAVNIYLTLMCTFIAYKV